MGKKRRAISAPQKHKVRARILGVNNTTTTSNSEANEVLKSLNVSNNTNATPAEAVADFREDNPIVENTAEIVNEEPTPALTVPEPAAAPPTTNTVKNTVKNTPRPSATKKNKAKAPTVSKTKATKTRKTRAKKIDSSEA